MGEKIKMEICWTCSNIAAEYIHADALIESGVISKIIKTFSDKPEVAKQAIYVIRNLIIYGKCIERLLENGFIEAVSWLIERLDLEKVTIKVALNCISLILIADEIENKTYKNQMVQRGMLKSLEAVRENENTENDICERVIAIIRTFNVVNQV